MNGDAAVPVASTMPEELVGSGPAAVLNVAEVTFKLFARAAGAIAADAAMAAAHTVARDSFLCIETFLSESRLSHPPKPGSTEWRQW